MFVRNVSIGSVLCGREPSFRRYLSISRYRSRLDDLPVCGEGFCPAPLEVVTKADGRSVDLTGVLIGFCTCVHSMMFRALNTLRSCPIR
jgi:hypothetical protein